MSYDGLLPNKAWTYDTSRPGTSRSAGGRAEDGGDDGTETTQGTERQLRALGKLNQVGRLLLDHLQVPATILWTQLSPRASVGLWQDKAHGFQLAAVRGDPYARVILYQALDVLKDDPQFREQASDLPFTRVTLSLSVRPCLDERDLSLGGRVLIDGPKLTVEHCFPLDEYLAGQGLATATDQGRGRVGINLLWPLWYAIKEKQRKEVDTSPTMRALRQHPAYKGELAF